MKGEYLYKYTKTIYPEGENYFNVLVENNSLWFSNPNKFNDLYDCNFDLDYSELTPVQIKRRMLSVARLMEPDKREAIFGVLRLADIENGRKLISEIMNRNVKAQLSQIGVTCLSVMPTNDLMWAHYANDHKGICLIFNPDEDKDFFNMLRMGVRYTDTPPITDVLGPIDLMTMIFTKSSRWAYEEEIRLVRANEGSFTFNKDSLKGVILGNRMPADERERIIMLFEMHNYNLEYHELIKEPAGFKFAVQKLK